MEPRISSLISGTKKSALLFILAETVACTVASFSLAQTGSAPPIKVESHEVVLPIEVIRESRSVGAVIGPDGEPRLEWFLHFKEVTGLSAKSVHVFDDAAKMVIQHFSVEKALGWEVRDNFGHHLAYSCTPRGIWVGPDTTSSGTINESRVHTYLVTYVPPPSPTGSCHRISIKVDRRHTTVVAPSQYCNTEDPLSDPLKETGLGNKLLAMTNSDKFGGIPLSVVATAFAGPSRAGRVNLVVGMPADLLDRHWDGIHLVTSIAVLGLIFDRKGTLVSRFSDTACAPAEESNGYEGPIQPLANGQKEVEDVDIPAGYMTQLDLNPGDYQLELLLTDGEKFGRARASLTVDNFSAAALSLSGIALCKWYHKPSPDERGPTRAPQYVPLMFDAQEFTPEGDTRFKKGEQLMTYVELYGSELRAPAAPKLYLEMKITDEKTNELKIGTGLRPVDSPVRLDSQPPAIPVVWEMDVAKLPPGGYRLEAQASDSTGNKTEWRAALFTVK